MKKTGFYIIKDRFFEDMPDPYLKGNKAGNRQVSENNREERTIREDLRYSTYCET